MTLEQTTPDADSMVVLTGAHSVILISFEDGTSGLVISDDKGEKIATFLVIGDLRFDVLSEAKPNDNKIGDNSSLVEGYNGSNSASIQSGDYNQ